MRDAQQGPKSLGEEALIANYWSRKEWDERINTLLSHWSLFARDQRDSTDAAHCGQPLGAQNMAEEGGERIWRDKWGLFSTVAHIDKAASASRSPKWGMEMCGLLRKYQTTQLGESS